MKEFNQLSSRTVTKILKRLRLKCFECGWNECIGDIHHIIPKKNGGSDDLDNLTYLCPNCHRKAHNNLLTSFKTLKDEVGDSWLAEYNPRTPKILTDYARSVKNENEQIKIDHKLKQLIRSNVDRTKYGWAKEAAKVLDIHPQSVIRFLRKHQPAYLIGAFKNK